MEIQLSRERSKDQLSPFGQQYMGYTDSFMSKTGGSFAQSLRDTFYKGSGDARAALVKAFPKYFNELDLRFDYHEPVPEDEIRYSGEEGKRKFMEEVDGFLKKKYGKYSYMYIDPDFKELFYTHIQEMAEPVNFHFETALEYILESYEWIQEGDHIRVHRNQAYRDGTVLKVIGDEALIHYVMPKSGMEAIQVVKVWNHDYIEDTLYKTYTKERLPKKWR